MYFFQVTDQYAYTSQRKLFIHSIIHLFAQQVKHVSKTH